MSHGKAISYLPVLDLLRDYFHIDERDNERRIREKVTGKLLTLDESLARRCPPSSSSSTCPPRTRSGRTRIRRSAASARSTR